MSDLYSDATRLKFLSRSFLVPWLAPLVTVQAFWLVALSLFIYGPWPWIFDDRIIYYLLSASLAMFLGYVVGGVLVGQSTRYLKITKSSENKFQFTKWAIVIAALMAVPTSLARSGHVLPPLIEGFFSPGVAYTSTLNYVSGSNPFVGVEYIRFLLAPMLFSYFILTIIYWKDLSLRYRVLSCAAFGFYIAIFISAGKARGLGDFLIVAPFALLMANRAKISLNIGRVFVVSVVGSIVAVVIFSWFFYRTQVGRAKSMVEAGTFTYGGTTIFADRDNTISRLIPDHIIPVYESFVRYLTQGYQALSFSFDMERYNTLGFGNSIFLARNADRFFNTDFFEKFSIPGVLQDAIGWSYYGLWHSIYPWIASDLGWEGAIVFIGALGIALGYAWALSILEVSISAIIFSMLLIQILFYAPSSNAVLQDGEGLFAFVIVSVWFVFSVGKIWTSERRLIAH